MNKLKRLQEMAGIQLNERANYSIEITDKHVIIRDELDTSSSRQVIAMPIDDFETIIESFFKQMG